MSTLRPIAYYISAHGYGHAVRSCDILTAFHDARPDIPVHIISGLPEAFLRSRLPEGGFSFREGVFDVGMVQLDSVRVDVPATLSAVLALYTRADEIVEAEAAYLAEHHVGLVVVDIPALPVEAAVARNIPALAVGNFAWDWIYRPFGEQDVRWQPVIDRLSRAYGAIDLLLRLPFSEPMQAFPRQEKLGLLASPGRRRRDDIAAATACDPEKKWVLLSFTSLDWDEHALDEVEKLGAYEFLTVYPLVWDRRNIHGVRRDQIPFADVLASSDAVISKPGFGLLSECVVNAKPLAYVERTDFIEYPILEDAARRFLSSVHLPARKLYAGDLAGALADLWEQPPPDEFLPRGGQHVAASRLAEWYGKHA